MFTESIQTVSDTKSQSPSLDSTTGTSSPSTCNYTQSLPRSSAKKGYSCTKVNFSSPIPGQTATQWLRPAWTPRMLMSFPAKLRCLRVLFSFNASRSTWRSRITAESGHGDIFTNPKNALELLQNRSIILYQLDAPLATRNQLAQNGNVQKPQ